MVADRLQLPPFVPVDEQLNNGRAPDKLVVPGRRMPNTMPSKPQPSGILNTCSLWVSATSARTTGEESPTRIKMRLWWGALTSTRTGFGQLSLRPHRRWQNQTRLVEFGRGLQLPALDASGEAVLATGQGSSFACALACGQSALVQEWAISELGAPLRGDELKAMLVACAEDLGPPGPDFQFGFGQMQLDKNLEFISRIKADCLRLGDISACFH